MSAVPMPAPTPPVNPNPSIPSQLQDPLLIANILAELKAESARANEAEKHASDLAASRDEWKGIADKEAKRADALEKADIQRQEEAKNLRDANTVLKQSNVEYKSELDSTRKDLDRAKSSRPWWAAGGAVMGYVVCRGTRP